MNELSAERRRRLTHRAFPALVVLALLSVGVGMVVGAGASSASERTARSFSEAWERQDYGAMYALLDDESRRAYSRGEFRRAYRDAAATATAERVETRASQRAAAAGRWSCRSTCTRGCSVACGAG